MNEEKQIYGMKLVFGDGHEIKRITNLPSGAKAQVNQRNDEFLTADIIFPNGRKEFWYLAEGDKPGEYCLELLGHLELGPFGAVYSFLAMVWLYPLKALWWLTTPVRWPFNFLANDWREYRKELDSKIRK